MAETQGNQTDEPQAAKAGELIDGLMDQWSQKTHKQAASPQPSTPSKPSQPADHLDRLITELPPRNWLPLVLAALCGLGVGIALGLTIASLGGKSLAEVTKERDQSNVMLSDAKQLLNKAKQNMESIKQDAQRLQKLNKEINAEHAEQLTNARQAGEKFAKEFLKSQALICMMRDIDGITDLVKSRDFRSRFKAEWFAPDDSYKLIGGKWFVEELVQHNIVDESVLNEKSKSTFDKPGMKWRIVKQWKVRGGAKDTETFEINSRVWKIAWTSQSPVGVSIAVYREGVKYSVADAGSEGSDSSIVREGPGSFYLRIAGGTCEVSVQEPDTNDGPTT